MSEASGLVAAIKQAANEANEASKPVQVVYGTVTQESPLQISVNQKLILGAAQLSLCRDCTDYETEVSIYASYGWKTQPRAGGSGEAKYESHDHDIVIEKKKIWHWNHLKAGERVILVRQQEGQKYVVIDRVVNAE